MDGERAPGWHGLAGAPEARMDDESVAYRALRGALPCSAVGLLVGGLEMLPVAVLVKIQLSSTEFLLLGLIAGLMYAVVGALVGGLLGLVVHPLMSRLGAAQGQAVQLGLTTGALLLIPFSGFALDAWADARVPVAAFLLFMPLLLTFTSFLLGLRLFSPGERRLSPLVLAGLVGGLGWGLLLVSGLLLRSAQPTGGTALDSDPRFVVVVVDSLRADLGSAPTPNFDRVASAGVIFTSAITSIPDTAPAVASLHSGLSPLHHEVLGPGDRLRRVGALLPPTFQDEGYATGGFVSSSDLSHRSSFDYGFQTFDDDFAGALPALNRLRILGLLQSLGRRAPASRPDAATTDRFLSWLGGVADRPFYALVHLHGPREPFEPHGLPGFEANGRPGSPSVDHRAILDQPVSDPTTARALKRLYREEVVAVDEQLGRILDALQEHRIGDRTVVMVMGTGGELLGEHGDRFTHRGLYEPTVKVPILLSLPRGPRDRVVSAAVRVQDFYATLLAYAEVRPRHEPESVVLLRYLTGEHDTDLSSVLIGQELDDSWWIGLRSNDMKYLAPAKAGEPRLFDLEDDPFEREDVHAQMPDTASKAERVVRPERIRLQKLLKAR